MQHTQAKVHSLKRCLSNSSAPCKGKVTGTITVHRVCNGQDNEVLFDMRDKAVQRTAAKNPIACCAAIFERTLPRTCVSICWAGRAND